MPLGFGSESGVSETGGGARAVEGWINARAVAKESGFVGSGLAAIGQQEALERRSAACRSAEFEKALVQSAADGLEGDPPERNPEGEGAALHRVADQIVGDEGGMKIPCVPWARSGR